MSSRRHSAYRIEAAAAHRGYAARISRRAGISVEYLTRIEQGRDRNPSVAVVNALADALSLSPTERTHLRYLTKITGGECTARTRPAPPPRHVRDAVQQTLHLLEPGIAVLTNRLGDILAHTCAYQSVTNGSGLLDTETPNLTRYVFADPRARTFFADWDDVADEQATRPLRRELRVVHHGTRTPCRPRPDPAPEPARRSATRSPPAQPSSRMRAPAAAGSTRTPR